MKLESYSVPVSLNNYRIDKALSSLCPDLSRNQLQKMIKNHQVKLNGAIISNLSDKVKENDLIEVRALPPIVESTIKATNLPLDIIYEDTDLIVINKSSNMTVHPGAGTKNDTLVNALLYHQKELSPGSDFSRPGIVHRLDKNTSGLMVVAKNNYAHQHLAAQIAARTFEREYKALIWGLLQPTNGTIDLNIGRDPIYRQKMTSFRNDSGKKAITHYETLKILHNGLFSLVKCKLDTGRTHQIRVHLSHTGHSIVGDQIYGNNARKIRGAPIHLQEILTAFEHQALHSFSLNFTQPSTGRPLSFVQNLPDDYQKLLDLITITK